MGKKTPRETKLLIVLVAMILIFTTIILAVSFEIKSTTKTSQNSLEQAAAASAASETQQPTIDEKDVLSEISSPTSATTSNGFVVAIDPGHQNAANLEQEPIGPGATETKYKCSGGTTGVFTGISEAELNLEVAMKLGSELETRGYQVVMTHTDGNVDISNIERANIANEANADIFIRIHANGSEDYNVTGVMTICMTPSNPYNGELHYDSRMLADYFLDGIVNETNAKKLYVWETDTMTGINWCKMPVVIVEMGFMTNPEEDKLLNNEEYQGKLSQAMADAIDKYFEEHS